MTYFATLHRRRFGVLSGLAIAVINAAAAVAQDRVADAPCRLTAWPRVGV